MPKRGTVRASVCAAFHASLRAPFLDCVRRPADYIQWLFPTNRPSEHNFEAKTLTGEDIRLMTTDVAVMSKMDASYKFYINFMGYNVDPLTGKLTKITPNKVYKTRMTNIREKKHNYKRITRILEWLRIMGRNYACRVFKAMLDNDEILNDQANTTKWKKTKTFWKNAANLPKITTV